MIEEQGNINDDDPIKEVQNSIEKVIGTPTSLKRRKITRKDVQKELFEKMIFLMEGVNARSMVLNMDMGMDLTSYDELFFQIIDSILELKFGKDILNIIYFYLYERIGPEGNLKELQDEKGNSILLNNPSDLWELIQTIQPKTNKI